MGMYDTFILEEGNQFGFAPGEYQTKDLDCSLHVFTIDENNLIKGVARKGSYNNTILYNINSGTFNAGWGANESLDIYGPCDGPDELYEEYSLEVLNSKIVSINIYGDMCYHAISGVAPNVKKEIPKNQNNITSNDNHNITMQYRFSKHDHAIMRLCYDLADMSTCKRAKMGAVIAIDEATFITGYNGTIKGFPNECDEESLVCDVCNVTVDENEYKEGDKHCKRGTVIKRPKTIHTVIHAETNAIIRAGKHGIKIEGKTIYMTTSPCVNCSNNIIQAGLSRVIFDKYHDDVRGLDILKQAGVEVIKYNTYKK